MTPNYPPELHHLIVQDIREVFNMTYYNPSMIDGGQYNIECPHCNEQIHEKEPICPYCQLITTEHNILYNQSPIKQNDPRDTNDLQWEQEELPHIIRHFKENMV